MNSLQTMLQADKEKILKSGLPVAEEREAYDALNEAIELAGGLKEADSFVAAAQLNLVWPMLEVLSPDQAAGVVLVLCARMQILACLLPDKTAEVEGLPTDRDMSPEGVEKTLEAARTGTQPTPGPGGPAGLAKPAPEDDLGELDPSQACKTQDGECESCQ